MKNLFKAINKQFKKSIDNNHTLSILSDKVWVEINSESKNNFIFKSDGKLIYTKKESIVDGSWEYIKSSNVLIVEFATYKSMYLICLLAENYLVLEDNLKHEKFRFINQNYLSTRYRNFNEATFKEIEIEMETSLNYFFNKEENEQKAKLYDEKYGNK